MASSRVLSRRAYAAAHLLLVFLVLAPQSASLVRAKTFVPTAPSQRAVSAVFAFGDSLTDGGNTRWHDSDDNSACFDPYGKTALRGSCRWSDGKVMVDFIVDRLHLPPVVPSDNRAKAKWAAAVGTSINFAVSGSGVTFKKEQTPNEMVDLNSQVNDFLRLRIKATTISKALFFITAGGNDFAQHILEPSNTDSLLLSLGNSISRLVPIQAKDRAFVTSVVSGIVQAVKRLHAAGARRFLIPSVPALGCNPAIVTASGQLSNSRACLTYPNRIASTFVWQLRTALRRLRLPRTAILVPNLVDITRDMWNNPAKYGFATSVWSCCHGGKETVACGKRILGIPLYSVCPDASKAMFWDGIHFSHAAAAVLAERMWSGDRRFVTPVNLKTLVGAN